MLQSMTGFGQARLETETYSIAVELKSLNSKTMDLSLRLPRFLMEKELEIRNLVTKNLVRGKVNLTIEHTSNKGTKTKNRINHELLQAYYQDLDAAANLVGADKSDLFRLALQMPDVMVADANAEENEAEAVKSFSI